MTISTETTAPVVAGVRLRVGRAGSSRGAASVVTEVINTATAAGARTDSILVRGDSAYGNGKVITAVVKAGARYSFTMARNPAIDAAIAAIPDDKYTPVHYPGAVTDPDTGQLVSETTGRLIVRRVLDANTQDPLFPVWRYHPFLTNTTETPTQADITHRRHAIYETVWSDLIDGPWAHQPSGRFPANAAWRTLAAICHDLLRAAGTLTSNRRYAVAEAAPYAPTWSTSPPASPGPNADPDYTSPRTGPAPTPGSPSGRPSSPPDQPRPNTQHHEHTSTPHPPTRTRARWTDQQHNHAPNRSEPNHSHDQPETDPRIEA